MLESRDVEESGGPKEVNHVPGLQELWEEDATLALQVRQQQHLGGLQRLVHVVNRQLKGWRKKLFGEILHPSPD
jgi:hypothetical protein